MPLGTAKQRCLLALLLLDAGALVHVDRLTELMWGDQPPSAARTTLQVYISRLRRALAGHPDIALNTSGPCYQLHIDPDQIDLHRFRRLAAEATSHRGDALAAGLFRQALTLWRGRALDDVAPPHLRHTLCVNLNDERLAAWENLIDVELRRANHSPLLRELTDLAEQHPFRERLALQLMTALYRNGQRAAALAHYQAVRARLATELGIDPSPDLETLHQRMLRDDPGLAATSRPPATNLVTPAQLPADLVTFTGRRAELNRLAQPDKLAGAVVISAIDGMPGVGKTTLALHWAHRIAPRFPDGQFFLDLHGHTPDVQPMDPAAALNRMLRDLGLPGERIPHELDERAALYRSLLAGRRMLLVLDNAAAESQIQPLLPGAPGCLVILTSRRRLAGLDTTYQVSLDTLPPDDAVTLFTRILGPRTRTHADAGAITELVALLGHLPLALRIAAARLRARPSWTPAHLAERLRDERHRLTELDAGQRGAAAAFGLSVRGLPPEQRRLFRMLGLHLGPDFDVHAVAALTDDTVANTSLLLERLVDENLLLSRDPDRYQLHDLLRIHAADRAEAEETEPDRRHALIRLFDHYAATAARRRSPPHHRLGAPALS